MMGYQLVARVYSSWTHLPDRPFRLLAYMALIARDDSKEPTFWGGREALADALGMHDQTPSQRAMVKRAVRDLVSYGALRRAYIGHAGKRTEYVLTLEKGNSGVTPKGNSTVTPEGNSGVTEGEPLSSQRGNSTAPPRTKTNHEDHSEESNLVPDSGVTRPSLRVIQSMNSDLDSVRARLDAEAAR